MSKYDNYTPTELLRELSLAFGPSGCEGNVADIIKEFIAPYADEVTSDRLGTVIAVYRRAEDCVRSADPDEDLFKSRYISLCSTTCLHYCAKDYSHLRPP